MATQAQRSERTRSGVLDAAGDLFGTQGYTATSIGDILDRAAVSRGALYHHFTSKEDVFAAVFVATSTEVIRRSVAAGSRPSSSQSPLDSLTRACLAWLDEVKRPEVSRILLVDGPAVLGWDRARKLEEATSLGVVRRGLAAAHDAGEITVGSIDLAARLVNAVLAEAALGMRVGRDRGEQRGVDHDRGDEVAVELVTAMIGGLAR